LNSHASGRRSGDQFCIYVFDRLVLPTLTAEDLKAVGAGDLSCDEIVKKFIRDRLSCRFVVVEDAAEARKIEAVVRAKGLAGRRPFLNPGLPVV